jgi:hypothetical protein
MCYACNGLDAQALRTTFHRARIEEVCLVSNSTCWGRMPSWTAGPEEFIRQ